MDGYLQYCSSAVLIREMMVVAKFYDELIFYLKDQQFSNRVYGV